MKYPHDLNFTLPQTIENHMPVLEQGAIPFPDLVAMYTQAWVLCYPPEGLVKFAQVRVALSAPPPLQCCLADFLQVRLGGPCQPESRHVPRRLFVVELTYQLRQAVIRKLAPIGFFGSPRHFAPKPFQLKPPKFLH